MNEFIDIAVKNRIAFPRKKLVIKALFVSRKVLFGKLFSKLSCVCLSLGKLVNGKQFTVSGKHFLVNGKHFPVYGKYFSVNFNKRKIWLGFQESVFLKNLKGKHFSKIVKNLETLLFADYIKFDPQTFDCYIYFVLNIYFSISSL